MSRDQKFFDMYSLVIGVLAAVGLAFFVVSVKISDLTQGVFTRDTAEYRQEILSRIKPVGEIYMPGEEAQAATPTMEVAAEPVKTVLTGPQVYNEACLLCHGAGIGGAPILGDVAAWTERIAQGDELMRQHAIEGYAGSAGVMPPKGGRMDLSDQEVIDAVDYMVAESQ